MKGRFNQALSSLRLPRFAICLATLAAGLMPAHSQILDPEEITNFWFEWMVRPPVSGPRLYITTEREILQTGPTDASFESGSSQFVLADGSVGRVWRDQIIPFFDEWDSDQDGWRDIVEIEANPPSNPFDPTSVPTNVEPDVFWTILANGQQLPVNLAGSSPALAISPYASPNIKLMSAPAPSNFERPLTFFEYSTQFYITNTTTSSPQLYGLALHSYKKEYPGAGQVGTMENDLVPGAYQVQFPLISNPNVSAGLWVGHNKVPNGEFTIGLRRPTWIVRSAEVLETLNKPPVKLPWVNGRLQLDTNIATTFKWDNIVSAGLASATADRMAVWIEDDNRNLIWPPVGASAELSVGNPQATLTFPGILPTISPGNPVAPSPINGYMVLRYSRGALAANSGDFSKVFLRVPIEIRRGYASWKNSMFPGSAGNDESISGPNADPDGDGLTNQQEFEAGSDPTKATIGVVNAFSENIDTDSATLGATVEADTFSQVPFSIIERGIIYSASATNPFPLLDGPGVFRISSPPADVGEFSVNAEGLSGGTTYSFRGYVITSIGTFHTPTVSRFTTSSIQTVTLPTLTSPFTSGITLNSINLGATVTDDGGSPILETGVVYSVTSTNDNPFVDGPGVIRVPGGSAAIGTFVVNVAGLAPSTSYSFRAYAITNVGISHTSVIGSFSTPTGPTINSPTVTNVGTSSATLGGNVTGSGGLTVLQRGVVFSSSTNNPVIGGGGVTAFAAATSGLGVFTVNVTGLQPNTQYFFKAYAINSVGTAYTAVGNFITTGALPTLGNPTIAEVTTISARIGATVTSDGQSPILERGFVYAPSSVNGNPAIGGAGVTKLVSPGTTGQFSTLLFNLSANTGYTFKAYARNAIGTAYSTPYGFLTTLPPLTLIDPTVSGVTATTAIVGGTVVSDAGNTVDERGVVLNTDPLTPPVIGGPGVIQLTGTGSMGPFTVDVVGLNPNTQYFFRAYATNISGTSYSDVAGFKTLPLVLLGLSEVEWLDPAGYADETLQPESVQEPVSRTRSFGSTADADPAADAGTPVIRSPRGIRSADGVAPIESASVQEPDQFIPVFVYHKHATELAEPMTYLIEVSGDSMVWQPADAARWSIDNTADTIKATWISTEPLPTRLFFRVKGTIASP